MSSKRRCEEGVEKEKYDSDESDCDSDDDMSDASSLDIAVGEDGRVPIGGSYAMDTFQSYPTALLVNEGKKERDAILDALRSDCRVCFTARSVGASSMEVDDESDEREENGSLKTKNEVAEGVDEGNSNDSPYSSGRTFWIGCDEEPKCLLEQLALEIFAFHSRNAIFDRSISGAEWWPLVMDATIDDVSWHWDKDYELEDSGINIHPQLACVTYLSTGGAPTMVLDSYLGVLHEEEAENAFLHVEPLRTSDKGGEGDFDGKPIKHIDQGWLSRPLPGKHMAFEGRWLHGALADMGRVWTQEFSSSSAERITFLVNVWLNHTPLSADPLPAEMAQQMTSPRLKDDDRISIFDASAKPSTSTVLDTSLLALAENSVLRYTGTVKSAATRTLSLALPRSVIEEQAQRGVEAWKVLFSRDRMQATIS